MVASFSGRPVFDHLQYGKTEGGQGGVHRGRPGREDREGGQGGRIGRPGREAREEGQGGRIGREDREEGQGRRPGREGLVELITCLMMYTSTNV